MINEEVFERIIKDCYWDYNITAEELKELFDNYTNAFTAKRIERNVLALRNVLLGERNYIKGLEWKKR